MDFILPNSSPLFIVIAFVIVALYAFALRYALFNKLHLTGKLTCLIAISVVPILGALVVTVYFWRHPEEL